MAVPSEIHDSFLSGAGNTVRIHNLQEVFVKGQWKIGRNQGN